MKSIDLALSAPQYVTRQDVRLDGRDRTDRELRLARKRNLDARSELTQLLRDLAAKPERHAALRRMLGPEGCARIERRITRLFQGGPDSEKDAAVAIGLWNRESGN